MPWAYFVTEYAFDVMHSCSLDYFKLKLVANIFLFEKEVFIPVNGNFCLPFGRKYLECWFFFHTPLHLLTSRVSILECVSLIFIPNVHSDTHLC